MSRLVWGAVLFILLLLCLAALAPARLLGLVLPAGQVVMQGFSGSLWRGSASRCLVQAGPGFLHMGAVHWRLEPLSLLALAPRLNLDSAWGAQTLSGTLVLRGERDLDLQDLDASFSAGLLRQFLPVALDGTLSLQVQGMQLRDGLPRETAGRLVWQDGLWQAPSGPLPLGSYAMDFHQAGEGPVVAEVLTLSGPVEAAGSARLDGRNYLVNITVTGPGAQDPRLQQALSLVARPEGQGYRIELDGEY